MNNSHTLHASAGNRAEPFRLTAKPNAIDTLIKVEGGSVFLCLRTKHEDVNCVHYIQVHLTPRQAEDILEDLHIAVEQARDYAFVAWVKHRYPDLWAEWNAGPGAYREG